MGGGNWGGNREGKIGGQIIWSKGMHVPLGCDLCQLATLQAAIIGLHLNDATFLTIHFLPARQVSW